MEIILDAIDFSAEHSNNGYTSGGELYFMFENGHFPEEHWYDCAYHVLKKWIPSLISFGYQHTDYCKLDFMDGPFSVYLKRNINGTVQAQCFEKHECIACENDIDLKQLLQSALLCCRKYDRLLYKNGCVSLFYDETIKLKAILDT